jgi:hypothetical protein
MKRIIITSAAVALLAVPAVQAAKPAPRNLTIGPNTATVKWGRTVTLSGKLTGNNNGSRPVTVEADPSPFDGSFSNVGSTTTNSTGDWTFAVKPTQNTRYRARSGNSESKAVDVNVRPAISLRVSDRTPAAGTRVRFSGRLCPEHDGVTVALQRRVAPKQWRTVRSVLLKDLVGSPCSRYARRVRVRKDSAWRIHFNGDANYVAGNSRVKRIDVH